MSVAALFSRGAVVDRLGGMTLQRDAGPAVAREKQRARPLRVKRAGSASWKGGPLPGRGVALSRVAALGLFRPVRLVCRYFCLTGVAVFLQTGRDADPLLAAL